MKLLIYFFSFSLFPLFSQVHLTNFDLEEWNGNEPVDWYYDFGHGAGMQYGTLNWFQDLGEPLSTFIETDQAAGGAGSSARLVSVLTQGQLATQGVPAIPGHIMKWTAYSEKPMSMAFDYWVKPLGEDFAAVYVEFYDLDTNLVGKGEVYFTEETSDWQRYYLPIDWFDGDVAYMHITCISSVLPENIQENSILLVDNFELVSSLTVSEVMSNHISIFPIPTVNELFIRNIGTSSSVKCYTYEGKFLFEKSLEEDSFSLNVSDLTSGKYILEFSNDQKKERRFFVKL